MTLCAPDFTESLHAASFISFPISLSRIDCVRREAGPVNASAASSLLPSPNTGTENAAICGSRIPDVNSGSSGTDQTEVHSAPSNEVPARWQNYPAADKCRADVFHAVLQMRYCVAVGMNYRSLCRQYVTITPFDMLV